jgi:hypothetical protein
MARSRTVWVVAALAGIGLAACILVSLHISGEWPLLWQTRPLHNVQPEQQHAYKAALGTGFWNSNEWPSAAQVLEDGQPLSLGNARHAEIREIGNGGYSFWDAYLLFSTSDNTDPRTNGRRYEAKGPYPIRDRWWTALVVVTGVLTVLAAGLAGARWAQQGNAWMVEVTTRARSWPRRLFGNPSFAWACAVFGVALLIQIVNYFVHYRDPALARLGMNVLGVPFSDSVGWDSLGKSIAAGQGLITGWEANRPFYGIFLALFYTWTNGSFVLAVLLNLVLTALTSTFVFRIGEAIFNKYVGLAAALAFCLNMLTRAYVLAVATETLGLCLLVATLYLLVIGVRDKRGWLLVGAGVCLGLSNITRPLTIFAFPAYLVCVLGFGWRTVSLRRGIVWMALLSLGLAVTLGPWLLRQRYVHGITTISWNTADALYCATTPRYGGEWAGEVFLELPPELITIKERYDWFMNRAIENIKTDPSFYVSNVTKAFTSVVVEAGRTRLRPPFLGAWLLVLLIALRHPSATRVGGVLAALAVAIVLAITERLLPHQVHLYFSVLGLLLAPWLGLGRLGLLLSVTTLFSILGIAIFGMAHPDLRLLLLIEWGFLLGYYALLYRVLSWSIVSLGAIRLVGWVESSRPTAIPVGLEDSTHPTQWPRWFKAVFTAMVAFLVVSGARLVYLNITTHAEKHVACWYSTERAQEIAHEFAQQHPDALASRWLVPSNVVSCFDLAAPAASGAGKVFLVRCSPTRYAYPLPASLELGHWSRFLQRRGYDRTVIYVELAGELYPKNPPYCYPVTFPGRIPENLIGKQCSILGFVVCDEAYPMERLSWEGMAIIPHDPATGAPRYEAAYIADDPRHFSVLQRHSESAASPTLTESHD